MSRVERIEQPSNRGDEQTRQSGRGRQQGERRGDAPNVGHTPGVAEGDERDIDEALNRRGEFEPE